MAKVELKTKSTNASVEDFINSLKDEVRKEDSKVVDKYMQEILGEKPKMWGPAIIGYGLQHLKYESGRELDMPELSFSPRKQSLVLYVLNGGEEKYQDLLKKLGKYTTGKVCLYIKSLSDIDETVLKEIIKRSLSV